MIYDSLQPINEPVTVEQFKEAIHRLLYVLMRVESGKFTLAECEKITDARRYVLVDGITLESLKVIKFGLDNIGQRTGLTRCSSVTRRGPYSAQCCDLTGHKGEHAGGIRVMQGVFCIGTAHIGWSSEEAVA